MKKMLLTLLFTVTFLLTGCAGLEGALIGNENTEGVGTYSFSIEEGCKVKVEARSFRGGPDVTVARNDAGECAVNVDAPGSSVDQLQKLIPLLQ